MQATADQSGDGRLVANLMQFARTLRAAGLPVGPGRVLDALRAVEAVGITSREDFYWALHASFVNRRDQHDLFDQAFHIFWRNPKILERMMAMLLPQMRAPSKDEDRVEMNRRLAEALGNKGNGGDGEEPAEEEIEFDAALTYSDRELLQTMDFEKMSGDELAKAKGLIAGMRLPIMDVATRRHRPDRNGARIDMRNTLRAALRSADAIPLRRRSVRRRHPPLVILCDISGSMSRYSRIALHFMHAVTNDRDRVYTFLFGTRLTNITRDLRHRDIDLALENVGTESAGLVRRHAHRPVPAGVQCQVVAAGARSGRSCAVHQRRAGPRRRTRLGDGNGTPAQILPTPDLAQSTPPL